MIDKTSLLTNLTKELLLYTTHDSINSQNIEPYSTTIPNELAGYRIDAAICDIIPELSRSKITNWIKDGHILLNNLTTKPSTKVFGGESILITPILDESMSAFIAQDIPLNIVYEDEHLIIINKPSGLTVHPGIGNWSGTLLNGLLHHYPEIKCLPRAGIVHRLDKDTSGLMVIARTLLTQKDLVQQLKNRTVKRVYRAIVEGNLTNGTINKNIGRDPNNRVKMAVLQIGGKEAITHYQTLEAFENFSYIECQLETGRTHQIRVHLKSIGHPLVGDPLYGNRKINYAKSIVEAITSLKRQALHAIKLSLIHPFTQELIEFNVPLATDIENLLSVLRDDKKNSELHDEDIE